MPNPESRENENGKGRVGKHAAKINPQGTPVGSEFFGHAMRASGKTDGRIYRCNYCEKTSSSRLPICTVCKIVAYCDKSCQKKHWKDHKPMCAQFVQSALKMKKLGGDPNRCKPNYGRGAGRVIPLEEKIKKHHPVRRSDAPNEDSITMFLASKQGKSLKSALKKYVHKFLTWKQNNKYTTKEVSNMFQGLLEGWILLLDQTLSSKEYADILDIYLAMFAHDDGPTRGALRGNDGLILLEYFARIGGDLAKPYPVDGKSLIHFAAQEGSTEIIKWLVKNGVNPNQHTSLNSFGQGTAATPLHLAIMYHRIEVVETLVKLPGIDLEKRNLSGKTPLHMAATEVDNGFNLAGDRYSIKGISQMLSTLKNAGADINALTRGYEMDKSLNGLSIADIASNPAAIVFSIENKIQPVKLDGCNVDVPQCPVSK